MTCGGGTRRERLHLVRAAGHRPKDQRLQAETRTTRPASHRPLHDFFHQITFAPLCRNKRKTRRNFPDLTDKQLSDYESAATELEKRFDPPGSELLHLMNPGTSTQHSSDPPPPPSTTGGALIKMSTRKTYTAN